VNETKLNKVNRTVENECATVFIFYFMFILIRVVSFRLSLVPSLWTRL